MTPWSTVTPSVSARDVDDAAARLRAVIGPTPLQLNPRLSDALGGEVWVKREDLQPVRSYKIRGAYNLIAQLPEADRLAGVVCASAGNHAQGVAFACQRLGVTGRVYLPGTTPRQKRDRVARLGRDAVEVRVVGNTYDEAAAAARADADSTGATQVPAFDDPRTVAGQGTIAREIVSQLADPPDVLVVPVGGGGLLAGAITYLREHAPSTRIVGVEPAGAASMAAAVAAGEPVDLGSLDPFVDGAAVRKVGAATFDVVRDAGVELLAVPEGRICVEMLALYQSDGIIAEPAGALSPAALDRLDIPRDATTVCLLSGGNNDVSRYADIVERALVFEGRKHYFLVEFPQEPGALRRFLDDVLGPDDDITLFEYTKRSNRETGPALVGIELGSPDDLPALLKRMQEAPPHIEPIPPDSPLFGFIL
ncbi:MULTISPECIES: threonine ammonia-lyase IlvA [Pseudonocardia]|jgi:threonine dehydratase|uniref:threonine ammonia-lyase IlvA n=1 Tax=Pseudonocardia TaxID=1847 RepID=UPI0009220532|nr:threonine ammonia-lyase IlvA [Pseudonocardia sp. SID8383]MYW71407.1 threonine ammonia-lyase IlvA [Pseudonocardia sp. SID8383]OJG05322.1 L-threonine dehydratase biosynthetic IlvA [Pseudonocardia autotrophica]